MNNFQGDVTDTIGCNKNTALQATLIQQLRVISEQAYVEKRQDQKLQALIDEIQDEQAMFAGARLTDAERKDMAWKETVLQLALEIRKSHEAVQEDGYVMPKDYDAGDQRSERYKVLHERYQCAPEESGVSVSVLPF